MTQPTSPTEVANLHRQSDVDSGPLAQHHTLGPASGKAAAGDHDHDGRNSKVLTAYAIGAHSHDGTDVSNTPSGGLGATNVQDALNELEAEIVGHTHTAQTAATTASTAVGSISATNVQAAIQELDTEKSPTGHNHDAAYVNETDHTLGQHTTLGLSPDTHTHDPADLTGLPINVTGARDDPESALANLLTALATAGIITDSTTAT